MPGESPDHDSFGALVGWNHVEFDGKLVVRLQTVPDPGSLRRKVVDSHHIMLTANQATLLANYLLTITQQTPPRRRKRGRLARWFSS
jgi:hypothetical protein